MKYELNEQELNNLMLFLDRVEAKGLNENQAFSRLIQIFTSPIQEPNKKNTK
ncbi:hypothetical protein [Halobacillus litoralis]|uniref:hypothetical protein n=1 Tax=Halobacillus litoralis TaxID=45668 RepID=UPI001CD304F0|nr:hypothetical protein [Halobacillus litoralis]MCA1021658.1 hypothetical protein [Halobacillus litoralis]